MFVGDLLEEPAIRLERRDDRLDVLAAQEMEFEPLLPPDEAALAERVEALGAWLQGYIYGVGSANLIFLPIAGKLKALATTGRKAGASS